MSKYRVNQTSMTEGDCLEEALQGLGHTVERHNHAVELQGWPYDRDKKFAEIVVPAHRGANAPQYDLGFKKQKDGSYAALIEDMDYKFGKEWLGKVEVAYGHAKVKKMADDLGLELLAEPETLSNGDIKVQYVQRSA